MLYKNERTFVLIDGSNIYYQTKKLSVTIDWNKFKEWLQGETQLIRIVYYTAILTDSDGFQQMRKLTDFLRYNGFDVRDKIARQFADGTKKGNMDVEISVDMIAASTTGRADNILLLSGDGDFCYAIEKAKMNGSRVGVLGARESGSVSDDVRKTADYMIDFGEAKFDWIKPFSARSITNSVTGETAS